MDQSFENEVMEELAAETPLSSDEDSDEFASREENLSNDDISDEMYEFEEDFEDRFEQTLEDEAFAELNGRHNNHNDTERPYEFDNFDVWEVGAHAETFAAPPGKIRQKRADLEQQQGQNGRSQKKLKRPKKQPLGSSSFPSSRSLSFNQLQGEVYANLPQIFQSISDPKTKSVLRTVEAALENTDSPNLQRIGQSIGALIKSLPADEYEALEAMFDWAEEEDALDEAAPAIAHLTVSLMAPKLPSSIRHQLLKSITQATRLLGKRQGAEAARAVPAIVQSVLKTAKRRRMPVQALPQKVYRTIAQVGTNRALLTRLSG